MKGGKRGKTGELREERGKKAGAGWKGGKWKGEAPPNWNFWLCHCPLRPTHQPRYIRYIQTHANPCHGRLQHTCRLQQIKNQLKIIDEIPKDVESKLFSIWHKHNNHGSYYSAEFIFPDFSNFPGENESFSLTNCSHKIPTLAFNRLQSR